jgi:hypothetical protein
LPATAALKSYGNPLYMVAVTFVDKYDHVWNRRFADCALCTSTHHPLSLVPRGSAGESCARDTFRHGYIPGLSALTPVLRAVWSAQNSADLMIVRSLTVRFWHS